MQSKYPQVRVGLVGLGLQAYWSQFEGLKERLNGYLGEVARRIGGEQREIVNLGLLDSPQASIEASHRCRQEDIDLLLIYVTTYALSSTVLPLVRRARVPIILLNLQPDSAIDYGTFNALPSRTRMTGDWLAYCNACPVPEIANVLRRLNIPFQQVTGSLAGTSPCWPQLIDWLRAAEVVHKLAHSRLGLMGHYYGGMLDIATDLAQVSGRFDLHIEMIEVEELATLRRDISEPALEAKLAAFEDFFQLDADCSKVELARAARTSIALDRLIKRNNLDLIAYYHKGSGVEELEDVMSSIILGASMLTAAGVPVAGEYEVKNVIAMKVLDLLGCGGSFTEHYAVDFNEELILMGHDGPGHAGMAQDKIKVRSLSVYHGKVGAGLSVEMAVQHGPVTLLSVVEDSQHGFLFLMAQGESVPGPILEIGNTNSRYRFPMAASEFLEAWNCHGPAHHCAVGVGHAASRIVKVATLLGFRSVLVC